MTTFSANPLINILYVNRNNTGDPTLNNEMDILEPLNAYSLIDQNKNLVSG